MDHVYTFDEQDLGWVNSRLQSVLQTAKQCGIEFEYELEGPYAVKVPVAFDPNRNTKHDVIIERYNLHYNIPRLSLGDYSFVAHIEYEGSDLPLTRSVPGVEIPAEMFCAQGTCEHCGVKRYRKSVFIVRNSAGEFKRVGSTCINLYLGTNVLGVLEKYASFVGDLCDDDRMWGNRRPTYLSYLMTFVMWSIYEIKTHGFVSKAQVQKFYDDPNTDLSKDLCATSEIVYSRVFPSSKTKVETQRIFDEHVVGYADLARELIEEIRQDAAPQPFTYQYNVAHAFQKDVITSDRPWQLIPFIAARINQALKAREPKPVTDKMEWTDAYFGAVKVRARDILIEVISSRQIGANEFGPRYLSVFRGPAGEELNWFGGKPVDEELIGKAVTATFTVVKHQVYNGAKKTLINRAVFEEIKN